jgi:predicted  nucleic acid-binding Zn-ribbon protein
MASITFADELVELRKQLDGLRDEVAALRDAQSQIDARMKAQSSELANAVESAAERIEDITQKMNAEGKRVREADSL